MNANELSAKYICEDKERLQMALHVYEAMPTVRTYLIRGIFKAVGENVAKRIDGVGVEEWNSNEEQVYFWTKETSELGVYAWAKPGKGKILSLVAGVYVDDAKSVSKAERDAIRERFKKVDLATWSYGESFSSDTEIAYAYVHHEHGGGRWDQDDFLRRAIQHRDDVVSDVADVLVRVYKGMFVPR